MIKQIIFSLSLFLLAVPALQAADEHTQIRNIMAKLIPGETPDSISATPVDGLYEVVYGLRIYYLTADGRYLFNGDLIDLADRSNLTETHRAGARVDALKQVSEESMIVYPASGERKHTLTVFTDIDCGYCRKLHKGMAQMNELGIEVHYLAYPRAGVGSNSYDKAVSVWCDKDRNQAMDRAKAGESLAQKSCDNPVKEHMQLGNLVGVTGTPALVTESGRLLPGYLPPERLLKVLEEEQG